jgi:hypothetical protein
MQSPGKRWIVPNVIVRYVLETNGSIGCFIQGTDQCPDARVSDVIPGGPGRKNGITDRVDAVIPMMWERILA